MQTILTLISDQVLDIFLPAEHNAQHLSSEIIRCKMRFINWPWESIRHIAEPFPNVRKQVDYWSFLGAIKHFLFQARSFGAFAKRLLGRIRYRHWGLDGRGISPRRRCWRTVVSSSLRLRHRHCTHGESCPTVRCLGFRRRHGRMSPFRAGSPRAERLGMAKGRHWARHIRPLAPRGLDCVHLVCCLPDRR